MALFENSINIFSDLIQNAILLFALVFIYGATNFNFKSDNNRQKVLLGFLIGFFVILVMLNPWEIKEGLIFDTRSVLMTVAGVFFGPLVTGIAAIIAIIYRIILGGDGVYAGVATIVTTASLGLTWHKIKALLPKMHIAIEYYVLGLIAHVITLLCFLLIPWPMAFDVIENTLIPFLGFFPILTMLLALSLNNQRQRFINNQLIKSQEILLQSSLDSTKTMEIFAIDKNYHYLAFNHFHKKCMQMYYHKQIEKGMNYLDCLGETELMNRIKSWIDQAFAGDSVNEIFQLEIEEEKYLEELYTPIQDDNNTIIGVTIFSQDVTSKQKHEQSILFLSYRDPLTNLYNRRFYSEELIRLNQAKHLPISIVIADINGLKIMNDAFGHDNGDKLLIEVSQVFLKKFSKKDRICRVGGDEFVILMPNTSKQKAMMLISDVKKAVEQLIILEMKTSVSFGLSTKTGEEPIEEIIKEAEDDMYTRKLFEISSHRNETIRTIIKTLHEKNPREELHSERVSKICVSIGESMHMSSDEISLLKMISNLHDIGKIAIDDAILNKPGKLDMKEWEAIKKHPEIGYRILSTTPEYAEIAQDILSHHERYDGKGYPRGLKGENIPIRARIISIADAYDAMISKRPYREPLTHIEAIDEIKKNMGTQFDPVIGQIFLDLFTDHAI